MTRRARGPALHPLRTTDPAPTRKPGTGAVPTVVVPTITPLGPLAHDPVTATDWRQDAGCAASDPETFFPLSYRPEELVRPARRICARCPVRAACLADVMATEDPARRWGVYGGTTPDERAALHRAGLAITPAVSAPSVEGGAA